MLTALRSLGARLLRVPRPVWAVVALAWIAMIAALSEQSLDDAPPGPLWRLLGNGFHVPLFGLLALWTALALPRREGARTWPRLGGRAGVLVVLFVGLNGVLDEWHQSTTGRNASWTDVVTDVVAAAWVVAVAHHAGRDEATERGTRRLFWGGAAACVLAAALASAL